MDTNDENEMSHENEMSEMTRDTYDDRYESHDHDDPYVSEGRGATMTRSDSDLCRRCAFHPVSPRIAGYCSWDCHDADDGDDEMHQEVGSGERAA